MHLASVKTLSMLFQIVKCNQIDRWRSRLKSTPKTSSAKFEIKNSMLIYPPQSAKINSCTERQSKKIISALLSAELNIFWSRRRVVSLSLSPSSEKRRKSASKINARARFWKREARARSRAAFFFLVGFFRVSLDGLIDRGTIRSLTLKLPEKLLFFLSLATRVSRHRQTCSKCQPKPKTNKKKHKYAYNKMVGQATKGCLTWSYHRKTCNKNAIQRWCRFLYIDIGEAILTWVNTKLNISCTRHLKSPERWMIRQ